MSAVFVPTQTAQLTFNTPASDAQAVQIVTLTSSGTDTYAGTAGVTAASYVTGTHYTFVSNNANTGACSLNIDGLGAKTIKKVAGGVTTDLADNDIRSGQVVVAAYDGTNFQIQSTLGNAAGGGSFDPTQPGPIGGTTPSTGAFTNITATAISTTSNVVQPASDEGSYLGTSSQKWYQGHIGPTGLRIGNGSNGPILSASGSSPNESLVLTLAGTGVFALAQSSGTVTLPSNSAGIRSKDVAGTAELFAVDEAGTETQISPHNQTAPASFYDSPFDEVGFTHNQYTAICVYTNKSRMNAGRIDFLFIETYDEHNARLNLTGDAALVQRAWATVQNELVSARDEERAAWAQRKTTWEADPAHANVPFIPTQPPVYVAKAAPAWLTTQLVGRDAHLAARTSQDRTNRIAFRTAVGGAVSTLRQWKTDADAATGASWDTDTTAQKFAKLKVVIQRFGLLSNRMADFIQAQRLDQ